MKNSPHDIWSSIINCTIFQSSSGLVHHHRKTSFRETHSYFCILHNPVLSTATCKVSWVTETWRVVRFENKPHLSSPSQLIIGEGGFGLVWAGFRHGWCWSSCWVCTPSRPERTGLKNWTQNLLFHEKFWRKDFSNDHVKLRGWRLHFVLFCATHQCVYKGVHVSRSFMHKSQHKTHKEIYLLHVA